MAAANAADATDTADPAALAAALQQQRATLRQPQLAILQKLQRKAAALRRRRRAAADDAAAVAAAAADDDGMIGDDFHAARSVFTDVSTRREELPSPPAPDERPPPSFATPLFLDEKTAAADFRAAVDAWRGTCAPVPSSTAAAVRAPQPPPRGDGVNGDAVGGAPTGDGTARAASSTSKNGGALGGSTDGADDADDAILSSLWIVA